MVINLLVGFLGKKVGSSFFCTLQILLKLIFFQIIFKGTYGYISVYRLPFFVFGVFLVVFLKRC